VKPIASSAPTRKGNLGSDSAIERTSAGKLCVAAFGMAAVLVTSCGGSEDDTAVVVYDESRDGPLPFALDFLPPADLLKYTVQVSVGTNIVKGNSDTGEAILLTVPAGTYIQSVGINFANHVDANALVTLVERFPYDGASFIDGHPMPSTGQYTYAVVAPTTAFGGGRYALRISTAVSGASVPNEFSLEVRVARP